MPAESILLIEDSPAERDIAQTVLEEAGYRVTAAANAAAALTYPETQDIDLIVMDGTLDGVNGYETTRLLRQQEQTHPIPILLLLCDESLDEREDLSARGADGYLLKPFEGQALAKKVRRMLEDQHLEDLARQYLSDSADAMMGTLAEQHIKESIDRKTQIIIERCIQTVADAVQERAKEEVDKQVTELTAEKEQELVKMTVREVAQSMVEKLAERKVSEAMETILAEQTERAVRRSAEQQLPTMVRDRVKESLNNTLPREVQNKVQKAAEKMMPELSEQVIAAVDTVASKSIPRAAREVLPELAERQFKLTINEQIPRLVGDLVGRELESQIELRLEPAVQNSARALRRTVLIWNSISSAAVAIGLGLMVYFSFFAG